jgi:hypothetical protein
MQRRLTEAEKRFLKTVCCGLRDMECDGGFSSGPREMLERFLANDTTDGLPYVEQPLTDEDAKQRPWVMAWDKDEQRKVGPVKLLYVHENGCVTIASGIPIAWRKCRRATPEEIIEMTSNLVARWRYARLATPEEIAAAGLEVAE